MHVKPVGLMVVVPVRHRCPGDGFFDARIRAAIPIAGAHDFPFGEQGRRDLSVPVMQMSGTADDDSPDWVGEQVGTPMHWVSIEQGCRKCSHWADVQKSRRKWASI